MKGSGNLELKQKTRILFVVLLCFCFFITVSMVASFQTKSQEAGIATIRGYAFYWENVTTPKPIKRATVEIRDTAGSVLGTGKTSDTGEYWIFIYLTGSKQVYAKILCESDAAIVKEGTSNNSYYYSTPVRTATEGYTTYLGAYYASTDDLHWRAMDYALDEYLWLEKEVHWTRTQVDIRYPMGNQPWTDGNTIYLPDRTIKNWNRPTVLHEYAHCVMYALYNGFPAGNCSDGCQCPQGVHYLNSVSDSGFAFKEGWADFMQSAVDDNPSNTPLQNLGDVDGDGIENILFTTIEDNGYTIQRNGILYRCKWYHGRCMYKPYSINYPSFNHNGCLVEGAVAGVLWDIFDSKNDDLMSAGFQPIWDVLYYYKPQNMMQFLDHWMYGGVEKELCTVCRDHGILMFKDINVLFNDNTYFIAGDKAYCTDVLGSAKTSFGLAKGGVLENPEGRTEIIATVTEEDTGNIILVGGPAVSPLAEEYSRKCSIGYYYNPGSSFEIMYHHKSIWLNLALSPNEPKEDICIVFLGEENARSSMVIWGYGWEGTYAGCAFIGDSNNWYTYHNAVMLMLRWRDQNYDELVQLNEVFVENYETLGSYQFTQSTQSMNTPESNRSLNLGSLFYYNTLFVAGDTAYCTDVLGSAKIAFGLAKGGAYENPEGRTETIIKQIEHDTKNLILVGGPAVSPLADEFDSYFGITYNHQPGVNFTIFCEDTSINLDLANYPRQDICIVYIGQQNGRNVMLVWGYGWQGTYAGSAFIGDTNNWNTYLNAHLLFLRWIDSNADGLVQQNEYYVESWK